MCAPSQGAMLPYGLKIPSPYFPFGPTAGLTPAHLSALDFQRSQLNDYNVRIQFGLRNYQNSMGLSPFHAYITDPYTQAYFYKHDPRARFVQEEPKPSHSYIGLIGMAILNSKEKKLVLSDIYQWILDNYPYFRTRGPGWRNSIRHNLSLNDCFIKAGRSANGKGHYWAVHPANVEDFERGDFRRRRAQRKVRRHMGLSVPDDEDSPTPSPTQPWPHHDIAPDSERGHLDAIGPPGENPLRAIPTGSESDHLVLSHPAPTYGPIHVQPRKPSKKRLFDMASLLAPDDDEEDMKIEPSTQNERTHDQEISGFSFHPINDNLKPSSIKTERKSSSDNTTDSTGSNSTQELIIDINSSSSGSGKEINYDSDYDHENNNVEIQVTSGENSPAQGMTEVCDIDPEHSVCGEYLTRNDNHSYDNSKIKTEIQDHPSSKSDSYQQISSKDSKTENALDLSSSTSSGSEKRSEISSCLDEYNANFILKQEEENNTGRQSNHMGMKGDAVVKKDNIIYDGYNVNGDSSQSPYGDSVLVSNSNSSCSQDRSTENNSLYPRAINNRCDQRPESISQMVNGGSELSKLGNTEKLHSFRSDLRQQNQRTSESKFGVVENGHRGTIPGNLNTDMRGAPLENSVALSEAMRISANNSLRWSDISKNTSRDRMSAFSTLGIRNQGMYSPFQMRNISLGTQRLLPTSAPLRGTGIPPPPLINASSCHSAPMSMLSGIEGSASTNSGSNSSNSSNGSTGSSRSNSRD